MAKPKISIAIDVVYFWFGAETGLKCSLNEM